MTAISQAGISRGVSERTSDRFEATFGASTADVLSSMAAAGDDLVQRAPAYPIAIGDVGCRRDLIVRCADPLGGASIVSAVCRVTIGTAVPATRRGVHMSRLGDALARASEATYEDVTALATTLADAIDASQYGGPTRVAIDATFPFVEDVPPEAAGPTKRSLESLRLVARVVTGRRRRIDSGFRVTHIVACPCVQQTFRHVRLAQGRGDPAVGAPVFTHSQRCETTVVVCGITRRLPLTRVLTELDAVIHRTRATLPRGGELLLVHRAHERPQFVEDAVRDVATAIVRAGVAPFDKLCVRSRSVESIHDFDLSARATVTGKDAARLATPEP
jgi:GTP cyclohydrolase FolE2